jgi:hypothetical protein
VGRRAPGARLEWRAEAVGDSDLSLTVLGLLADRDSGCEEPYKLTANSNGLFRTVLDVLRRHDGVLGGSWRRRALYRKEGEVVCLLPTLPSEGVERL